MLRKPRTEPEPATGELCGDRTDRILASCTLPKGHVNGPDDWHESAADSTEHARTNILETTITKHEHVRWAPRYFEIPGAVSKKLTEKLGLPPEPA